MGISGHPGTVSEQLCLAMGPIEAPTRPGDVLLRCVPVAEAVARTGVTAEELAQRGAVDEDGRCELAALTTPDSEAAPAHVPGDPFACELLGSGTL